MTAAQIKNAKPASELIGQLKPNHERLPEDRKRYRGDETIVLSVNNDGLLLRIKPDGTKYFFWRFRDMELVRNCGIGKFPDLTLADALEIFGKLKRQWKSGVDPIAARRRARAEKKKQLARKTFDTLADMFLASESGNWTPNTERSARDSLKCLSPHIGSLYVDDLSSELVADALHAIGRDAPTRASHSRQYFLRVMKFGRPYMQTRVDWKEDLEATARRPKRTKIQDNEPFTIDGLRELEAKLQAYPSRRIALAGLILMRTLLRGNELLSARREYLDLAAATLTIPGNKMKVETKHAHVVHLSRQTVALFEELLGNISHRSQYLFPVSRRQRDLKVMPHSQPHTTTTSLARVFRNIGYSGVLTPHGIRHVFSREMNERGFNHDAIELILAHQIGGIRGTYYQSPEKNEQRRKVLQAWSDLLEHGEIRPEENVLQFAREGKG